jgi:hypothetical protein
MRRAGEYFLPKARTRHVRSSTKCTGKYVLYHKFIFERNIDRGPTVTTVKISLT